MFDSDLPPFPGFRKEAFDFFRELARNNDREWFKERKAMYEDEVVWPFQCLLAEASREAGSAGLTLLADPKKALFRIYRDTRFSNNKDPYKTHAGAVFSRDGSSKSEGGVYVHLEPDACFLAAGFWHPENDVVRAWRQAMTRQPEAFLDMTERLGATGLTLDASEALKRMPAGYEDYADHAIAPFLRLKSYTISRPVKDTALQRPEFAATVVQMMHDSYPLLAFGWSVDQAGGR